MSNKKTSNKEVSNKKTLENKSSNSESIHDIDEQQLLDDEAFINSLYEEVQLEESNQQSSIQHSTSQPSEMLNKRIINAAHHAVKVENTTTNTQKTSRFTWVSGLASAASLTLVISLVVRQQGEILPPAESAIPMSASQPLAAPLSTIQADDEEMFTAKRSESSVLLASEQVQNRLTALKSKAKRSNNKPLISTTSLSSKVEVNVSADEKKGSGMQGYKLEALQASSAYQENQISEKLEITSKTQKKVLKASNSNRQKAEKMSLISPAQQSIHLATPKSAPIDFKILTVELFKRYLAENTNLNDDEKYSWSFISEQKTNYQIKLQQTGKAHIYYQLDKALFSIKGLALHHFATEDGHQLMAIQLKTP